MLDTNFEEIFQGYKSKGFDLTYLRQVKSGKEAVVHLVTNGMNSYALKVYKNPEYRLFKDNKQYIEGKFYRKPSVRKAVSKSSKFGKKFVNNLWIKREFYLLQKLNNLGVLVPKAYEWTENTILMEFIGNKEPAPRLIDIQLTEIQAKKALDTIVQILKVFLDNGIIHGDLSAYNILYWKEKPYIIDLPQSLDARNNPNKEEFLIRDVNNLSSYFEKIIPVDKQEVFKELGLSFELK